MVLDVLCLHGAEGSKAHMEGNVAYLYTHLLDFFQQFRGKMEPGSGGGGGAYHFGVDRLIPLIVLKLRLDVGRQRHLAQPFQNFKENALVVEANQALAVVQFLFDGGGELGTVAEDHLGARFQLTARAHQALPALVPLVYQQQHLAHTAGRTVADEPGGNNPGVVEHQTVPRAEELGQLIEMVVLHCPGMLVQGEKPGGIPPLQRGLGDELLGQVKVKI